MCILNGTCLMFAVSGINPNDMSGTNTAVFTGSIISESENIVAHLAVKYKYGMLGHCRSMLSNRISYWLDVVGECNCFLSNI